MGRPEITATSAKLRRQRGQERRHAGERACPDGVGHDGRQRAVEVEEERAVRGSAASGSSAAGSGRGGGSDTVAPGVRRRGRRRQVLADDHDHVEAGRRG